ncbi:MULTISPECIES: hypothetical protein [Delftia]|jgi:hypothetical protein|uniref:Uncharacterized protein n=1 Tax=Delftia lacustris TaxID=558537 RepID=A0A7T2YQN4_9BURK|nr:MULTISPECIES: hypothetical protein [Delftia]KAA9171898.1 hypothetical protein F3K36_18055 [Delftia sp. BR1]ATH12401.1 hypothetical protein CHL79_08155 [Delftia acidovorans]EPD35750.1 hypothetical protein HMPREF9702_05845 [Delftia acidovorans CCUG 15835]KEH07236.1 hypothetical protein GY14_28930 [Delftia tsuruhatensis]KLO58818.1 hypothetical protein AA671_14580 [Delftia tsuruhatensis]
MDLQYQLKAGSYCLYDMRETPSAITGERRCRLRTELVAIAFDLVTGQVHEHGSPTRIHAWALCTRRRLRAAGDWDQADSIVVVSGPLPVDEINKCLGIRGYCRRMFQRLASLPHGKLQPHAHAHAHGAHGAYGAYGAHAGRHQSHQGQQRRAA